MTPRNSKFSNHEFRAELNTGIKTVLMSIIKDKFKKDIDGVREKEIQDFLRQFSLNLLSKDTDLTYPFLYSVDSMRTGGRSPESAFPA